MAKAISAQKRAAYARLFLRDDGQPHEDGETVLLELARFCCIDKAALVVSPRQISTDVHATFYQLGLRDAYDHIVQILGLDPLARQKERARHEHRSEQPDTAKQ